MAYSSAFVYGQSGNGDWKAGKPLPIDGCTIMLCDSGCASFTINSRSFVISPGMMAFFAFDMVVIPAAVSDDFKARYLAVNFDTTQDIFFLVASNRFWDFLYKSPVFSVTPDDQAVINHWFVIQKWLYANCSESIKDKMMRNEVENFMLILAEQVEARLGMLGQNPSKNRAWAIVNDFIALLNRHYAAHHDVAFYAEKLNVTPNYLNIIVRRNIGTSAKEQINIQIGLVLRTLLDTTDLSVKQIAERVHYDDPSYLCRIFRKQTGLSPIQYRNKVRID